MPVPVRAVLVDVGGTLWPNVMPRESDDERSARVLAAFPQLRDARVPDVCGRLIAATLDAMNADTFEHRQDEGLAAALLELGLACDSDVVTRLRRALSSPAFGRLEALPGAGEFLRRVCDAVGPALVVSNTAVRDAVVYAEDFAAFGWSDMVSGYVTSVDVGFGKPHVSMFERALELTKVAPEEAVMVGNSERADIVPAQALGIRTILVAPDEPLPETTTADAMTDDLLEAATIIERWARPD